MQRELNKEVTTAGITIGLLTFLDVKVLNTMPGGKNLGPLRKSGIIIALNSIPVAWFAYRITN
jgi:hypothetical protein